MRLDPARRRRFGRPPFESWPRTAARLRGPLYAAADGGRAYQGGFGRSGSGRGMTVSVSVTHVRPGAELDIDTSDDDVCDDPAFVDWRLAGDWLHRALRSDASCSR